MRPFMIGPRRMTRPRQGFREAVCAAAVFSLLFGLTPSGLAAKTRKNVTLAGSRQGQAVGFVDVDGDGIDDKIVGAPYASASARPGAVLVYQGSAAGGFSPQPAAILTGDDNYGFSLVNLGDADSDGHDDFGVGALNGGGDLSGSVTVYQGGRNRNFGNGRRKILARLAGEEPLDKFGVFAAAGDLNHDGLPDLIVGAPYHTEDPALYQAGAVYVFLAPDFRTRQALYATAQNKGLGWSAAAGDVNGDLVADLCLSASGKVLCYFGGPDFSPATNSPDVTISSASKGFGRALAVADVNGDGTGDLAIGAPNAVINGARDTGSLYVVRGGPAPGTVNVDEPSPLLLARIDGAALFDRFGAALAVVDGQGNGQAAALLVGSPLADLDAGNHLAGKVYLFPGGSINQTATLADAAVFSGFTRDQGYGTSLAVDGDRARMMCGAPGTNSDTGWVAVVDLVSGQPLP